jgi:putative addiction module component (TIGR02574 family)
MATRAGVATFEQFRHSFSMVDRSQTLESLTAQERIALIGRLWDSLDPAAAAPLSPALAAELDRREAEADADPDAGIPWTALRDELRARLR